MGNTPSSEVSEDVTDGGGTKDLVVNEKLVRDFANTSGMTVEQVTI